MNSEKKIITKVSRTLNRSPQFIKTMCLNSIATITLETAMNNPSLLKYAKLSDDFVSHEFIKLIKKRFIVSQEQEWCSSLVIDDFGDVAVSDVFLSEGIMIGNRRACIEESHGQFIFHTHPIGSKAYPSMEDIRARYYSISIIVTPAGTWVLRRLSPGPRTCSRSRSRSRSRSPRSRRSRESLHGNTEFEETYENFNNVIYRLYEKIFGQARINKIESDKLIRKLHHNLSTVPVFKMYSEYAEDEHSTLLEMFLKYGIEMKFISF